MIFAPSGLSSGYFIEPDLVEDERGFFARTFSREEFAKRGLNVNFVQCGVSFNRLRGTLRGIHYQVAPKAEGKLIRCTRGAVFDVMVDLRAGTPTFGRWAATELTAENHRLAYVPEGFAHGFVTLADDTELFYEITAEYDPVCARGLRWDDESIGIHWPLRPAVISSRDQALPLLQARMP